MGNGGPGATHSACACWVVNVMFQPQARSVESGHVTCGAQCCVVFVLCLLPCCAFDVIRCDFFFD